jgi:HK97 family phage portal protein
VPNESLRARIGDAFKAAAKVMRFGGASYSGYGAHWTGRWTTNGAFNYAAAVGDMADNTIVAATVGWVARTYPEAPIRVVKETTKGDEPVPGHALTAKLKRPNPHYGYALLMKATIASYILDANAYWLKERTNGGEVLNYWYEPPWTMTPRGTDTEFIAYYERRIDGRTERWDVADVVHLKDELDPRNPRKGLSRLKAAIRLVYTDNAADEYASAILRNFGTPSVIISPASADQTMSKDEGAFVRESWQEKTTGENRGKAVVSLAAIKVDAPGFSPAEMDVRSLRWTSEERISAIIGIPAIVVGLGAGLEHGTYQNTSQAREAAYESYLLPVQANIADQLTMQIMPDFDDDPTVKIGHDYSNVRVLQPDADKMAERAARLFGAGMIDRDHALTMIGEEAEAGDKGIYFLPRGGSFSDGSIAEPVSPTTVPVNTEPGASTPAAANVNGKKPTDAAALAALTPKTGASS